MRRPSDSAAGRSDVDSADLIRPNGESRIVGETSGRLGRLSPREEKERIESALARSRGRVSGLDGAAVALGIPRSTLESKIRSPHVDKHRFKTG